MNIRVAFVVAGALVLMGGGLMIAQNESRTPSTVGQGAPPDAASAPSATQPASVDAADKTAAPAAGEKPAVTAAPANDQSPVVATEPPKTNEPAEARTPGTQPAPVTATAPARQDKPTVATEPAPQMKPAVMEPPAKTEAPVAAKPKEKEPAAVVATPPAASEKPAAAEPPAQQPTPVVTAPPAQPEKPATATVPAPEPAPKLTIVMTPLPEKRPTISKALLERTSPAKYLFAAKTLPSIGRSRAIGYYPKGCLAGGVELPVNGPTWQVMRLSRNRNWGHPELVRFLERFAPLAAKATGWPGILVGDMAQPRGGPLPFGHRSHQVGLDVDIWYRPMPDYRLSKEQRETMSATSLVAPDGKHLDPKTWTPADAAFIRTAAEQPEVERIFVNATIKRELCKLKGNKHWSWISKVRPWYGHDDHMHVRLKCPADSPHCRHQSPVPGGDGCSKSALAFWFSDRVLHPKLAKHPKPAKQIMLADLPAACKVVLNAPAKKSHLASEAR